MFHDEIARKLPDAARALLIEHVDGSRFVEVPVVIGERTKTRHTLLNLGLLKPGWIDADGVQHGTYSVRPSTTYITDDGRQVLAVILANYADALIRAGYGIVMETETAIAAEARRVAQMMPTPSKVIESRPQPSAAPSVEAREAV